MSVMAVLMGAALPVWNKQAQREREEEYLFRATRIRARHPEVPAAAPVPARCPPNFDVLVEQRFLRRKYKDPITGEDFQPVYQTVARASDSRAARPATPAPAAGRPPAARRTSTADAARVRRPRRLDRRHAHGSGNRRAGARGAGVIGVVSKSKATSIKVYNGRTRYDQWAVTYQDVKPGKGLPPDLLQALNATRAARAAPAAGGAGGVAPAAARSAAGRRRIRSASRARQPVRARPADRQPRSAQPIRQPGANPFGAARAANPFRRRVRRRLHRPTLSAAAGPGAGADPFGAAAAEDGEN